MPSLIYIDRLKSFSVELAEGLQSAGFHVKSFKPGQITDDECLLIMTSDALLATCHPKGPETVTGRESVGVTPTPDMDEQLRSQAAIWNSIKTAVTKESLPNREPVAARVASTLEPKAIELGFVATEVGRQVFANAQRTTAGGKAPIQPSQTIAVSRAEVSSDVKNPRSTKERYYRLFRNPLSTAVAVLVFALVYRGLIRPSTTAATSGHKVSYSTPSDSDPANSLLTISASPGRSHRSTSPLILSSAESPQATERVQRHLSDDDFVAEDFTNHFDSP